MSSFLRISAVAALSASLFSSAGFAQQSADEDKSVHHEHDVLEEIIVTANPLSRHVTDLSQSATVLQGEALRHEQANSLGETLARMPGMSNASFGENIGRPVIRGLQGTRVGILNNSLSVSDASSVSQDHAVSVEPFLTDQIEVLRGPATLLYGSGAIGGVVNMVSPSIPRALPENGYNGRAIAQGNTAANEEFFAGRLDVGMGSFALHIDGFHRRTDDYEIPGAAELYPEDDHDEHEEHEEDGHDDEHEDDHDEDHNGKLENSFLRNQGGTIGLSWIGDSWRFGAAYNEYKSDYGIPGGAHEHDHDEHEGGHDEDEHEDEHEEGHDDEEALVTIRLRSDRAEAELAGDNPFHGFEQLKIRYADTSYTHTEFEGDEVGTVFESDNNNVRAELTHNPWAAWQGVFGLQYTDLDFSAVGAEAFVPGSNTKTSAIFWVEKADFDLWQLDLGVRYEDIDIHVPHTLVEGEGSIGPSAKSNFQPLSASGGLVWNVNENADITASISYAERAPGVDELYANGPHIATQVFEVGNPDLKKESTVHVEIGGRLEFGGLTGSASVFRDDFDNYIYLSATGLEEDGLPLRIWRQQGATFTGAEVELRYDFEENASGHWQVFGFGDIVNGKLDNNTYAPLQPPKRLALGLDWDRQRWAANMVWIHAFAQDHTAPLETRTPGYDMLNAELVYTGQSYKRLDWEIYLKGQNLLNDDVRNSTSYLKDQAPQIGRNFIFGVRAYF